MTQEIKDKLQQASDALFEHKGYSFTPCDYAMRKGFLAGAQTILENPGEWGLAYLKDLDRTLPRIAELNLEMYKEIEDMKSQLTEYRQALERILQGNCSPTLVAKEALKQGEK